MYDVTNSGFTPNSGHPASANRVFSKGRIVTIFLLAVGTVLLVSVSHIISQSDRFPLSKRTSIKPVKSFFPLAASFKISSPEPDRINSVMIRGPVRVAVPIYDVPKKELTSISRPALPTFLSKSVAENNATLEREKRPLHVTRPARAVFPLITATESHGSMPKLDMTFIAGQNKNISSTSLQRDITN